MAIRSMAMRLLALVAVGIALACAGAAVWADEPQVTVTQTRVVEVGTIVSLERVADAEGTGWLKMRLRVDQAEGASEFAKPGDVLVVRSPEAGPALIGLGDQVRATLQSYALDKESLIAEEMVRLGRGEFLNPAAKATIDLGPADAKVLVKMFAPLGIACHQTTVDLLRELATAEPKRLRVQMFDVRDPAAAGEANRERLSCATVLINNRYQFTIGEGDKERKVELTHRPNAEKSTYNSEDVPVVVRQEIARIYGPEKPVEPTRPAA